MLPEQPTTTVPESQTIGQGEELAVVLARYQRAKENCRVWHDQIRQWRKLYNFDHYQEAAKPQEQQYADPTPTNTVDLAVGIFVANDMGWKAYGWKSSNDEMRKSSQVEKYLAGNLEIAKERTQLHITYEITKDFCRDGAGAIYSVWDPIYHEKYLTQFEIADPKNPEGVTMVPGFREPPIRTEVVDPLQLAMLPGGDKRWGHVFRTTEMNVFDIEKVYGISIEKYRGMTEEMKMTTKGSVIEYWRHAELEKTLSYNTVLGKPETSKSEVVIMGVIFETLWLIQPHVMQGYDDLPFTIGFFKPVDPNDPKSWGHSIMKPMESTITLMEQAVNRRLRQLTIFSSLPLVIKSEFGRKLDIDPGFGNTLQIAPQEDVGFPVWPGNPPDFNQHLDFLRSRLQQSGFSDVMFGSGPSAVSGYAMSQLGDQNRIRLEQPRRHLEMFWGTWAKKILSLTSKFANNAVVRVYGRMRGKDFAEQVMGSEIAEYMVKCYIKPQFPNEQTRRHAMATQVKGTLSTRTIMENYLDIEQPDDEMDRILDEMADKHPIMQQYAVMAVLQERADGGDKAAMMVIQQQQAQATAAQAAAAQASTPVEGAGPGNALGTASATGAPTPQAGGMPAPGQDEAALLSELAGLAPQMAGGGIG
jgi:hypothetical protein